MNLEFFPEKKFQRDFIALDFLQEFVGTKNIRGFFSGSPPLNPPDPPKTCLESPHFSSRGCLAFINGFIEEANYAYKRVYSMVYEL